MDDTARKEKLSAAKKKLKKFQKKSNRGTASPSQNSEHGSGENLSVESKYQLNGTVNGQNNNGASESPQINNLHGSPRQELNTSASLTPSESQTNSRLGASTERLHQLSRQINGLLTETQLFVDSEDSTSNGVQDLEQRNRELASLLQKHMQLNEQLNRQLTDMKGTQGRLQGNLDQERKAFQEKLKRELGALKEQLQVHIQTIGILVAEKTELQSSLTQAQKLAEQKLEEVEELSGRLKASRQRVGDLEKSFTSASSSSHKHEKSSKDLNKEVDRLKLELYKNNKSNEEIQQQSSELHSKLQKKSVECAQAENEIIELKGRLEMSQLHMEQLQNSGTSSVSDQTAQIEQLLAEKSDLNDKVLQYEEAFQRVSSERDQISQQYQEYIDQLTTQTQHLQAQINILVGEKEECLKKQRQLEEVIEQHKYTEDVESSRVEAESEERQELLTAVEKLHMELQTRTEQYQAQVHDNQQLSRMVTEKEQRVEELEDTVQRLSEEQVDKETLLDDIQSDKTALSRAMAQNKELKTQLAELQNGFVKMSNENMGLMTEIQSEQHTSKELAARLGQQEDELRDIRRQLEHKEVQLKTLQETVSTHAAAEGDSAHDDQLRHAIEQLPLMENLQRELATAQDTINALTSQNSELKSQLMRRSPSPESEAAGEQDSSQMQHLSASVRQLESERNHVLDQLQQEQEQRRSAQDKLHNLQNDLANQAPATMNGNLINKAQFEALQHAMRQLETKYTNSMRDKAELSDKIEQMEYLVMQLEGESETIGEYISLYQMQRGVLRKRQEEREEYIYRLARDREEMSGKLAQLQALVMQLLGERKMLHAYGKTAATATHNHIQPHLTTKTKLNNNSNFGAKLESSNLEDWPDLSSSDSDESEVERIVGTNLSMTEQISLLSPNSDDNSTVSQNSKEGGANSETHPTFTPNHTSQTHANNKHHSSIPAEDETAQRIMHLLSEIGNSNMVERMAFSDRNFVNCAHCTGKLMVV